MVHLVVQTPFWKRYDLSEKMMAHMAALRESLKGEIELTLVAVISENDYFNLCARHGWESVWSENRPLGRKANTGMAYIGKNGGGDGVLMLGSDDFVDEAYIRAAADALKRGVDIWGVKDIYFYCTRRGALMHWPGYSPDSGRQGETLGAGRVMSRKFLELVQWQPWDSEALNTIDRTMTNKIRELGDQLVTEAVTMEEAKVFLVDVKTDDNMTAWWSLLANPGSRFVDTRKFPFLSDFTEEKHAEDRPPKKDAKISGAMIIRVDGTHETVEFLLAHESLAQVVDEIIVVQDDRSTDLPYYPESIVIRPWPDSFSEQRNYAASLCNGEWIVVLDRDEEITNNPESLREAILNAKDETDVISVDLITYTAPLTFHHHRQIRAYRKDRCHYVHAGHNQLQKKNGEPFYEEQCNTVIRTSYAGKQKAKAERTIPLLLKELEETEAKHDLATWWHCNYYLARAYQATEEWNKVYEHATSVGEDDRYVMAWLYAALAAAKMGRESEAKDLLEEGYEDHPNFPEISHQMAALWLRRWYKACHANDPRYARVEKPSLKYTMNAKQAARMLGMPSGNKEE